MSTLPQKREADGNSPIVDQPLQSDAHPAKLPKLTQQDVVAEAVEPTGSSATASLSAQADPPSTTAVVISSSAPAEVPLLPHHEHHSAPRGERRLSQKALQPAPLAHDSAEARQSVKGASNDPNHYKNACGYSAEENHDLEDIYRAWDSLVAPDDMPFLEAYVHGLVAKRAEGKLETNKDIERALGAMRKELASKNLKKRDPPRKSEINHALMLMVGRGEVAEDPMLQRLLVKKAAKSLSGVLVVTVLTSPYPMDEQGKPQKFSCEWDCFYCPNEPGQPRSYLHDEPSVLRANRNDFDPVRQFVDRCATLAMNGHPVDKIELLVLGGTWTSYPHYYQEGFVRDLFYAANTFHERPAFKRAKLDLDEEKRLNESAKVKIIGLTLETRPDCIDASEVRRMRRYGCTRVQLGMQHTDDGVLKKINRGCTRRDMVRAVKLLKECCYKLDMHLMPNLPGATLELDKDMFQQVLNDPELSVDQWKIYPCEITPWTVIKKWFEEGSYVPYPDEQLGQLLLDVLPAIPPWVRVNRVVRDIPSQYILAGMDRPNLRQDLDEALKSNGVMCMDIRAREVKGRGDLAKGAELVERPLLASGADEVFLSFETTDRTTIFAFARLRLGSSATGKQDGGGRGGGQEGQQERGGGIDDGQSHVARSGRKRRTKASSGMSSSEVEEGGEVVFPELDGCALVRELHVYGQLAAVDVNQNTTKEQQPAVVAGVGATGGGAAAGGGRRDGATSAAYAGLKLLELAGGAAAGAGGEDEVQHVGLGTQLMRRCELIAAREGFAKVAVISGVGVRGYYRRLGYALEPGEGEFMVKHMSWRFRLEHHRRTRWVAGPLAAAARRFQSRPLFWFGAMGALLAFLAAFFLGYLH